MYTVCERNVLSAASKGDMNPFWAYWLSHQSSFHNYCLRKLNGDREHVEDLMSEVLLKVWDVLPKHAHVVKNLKSWIYSLIHRYHLDKLRRWEYKYIVPELDDSDRSAEEIDLRTPEENILTRERWQRAERCLNHLPKNQVAALMLRGLYGYSYEEIGRHFNISTANARQRVARARYALRPAN